MADNSPLGQMERELERTHAEVARLREERDTALRDWRFVIDEAAKNRDEHLMQFNALEATALQTARDLATERAAHEAMKQIAAAYKAGEEAAEARVAELESDYSVAIRASEIAIELAENRGATLDQARGLLERIVKYAREDRAATPGVTRLARALAEAETWLRSTAQPNACNEDCGYGWGGESCPLHPATVTPAATEEECEPWTGYQVIDAEKERGT